MSHDTHTNNYNYKYTFSVEIVPMCKVRLVPEKIKGGWLGPMKSSNVQLLSDANWHVEHPARGPLIMSVVDN